MRAAARFVARWLEEPGLLDKVARIRAEVFGSLALTGRGHGTDKAVLMGLEGHMPNLIDPDVIPAALLRIRGEKKLMLSGRHAVAFDEKRDLVLNKRQKLPYHTNGMRFTAYDANDEVIATRDYYSVGGGFVVNQDVAAVDRIVADETPLPHPFHSGDELLARSRDSGLSIAQLMFENEKSWRSEEEVKAGLREIWNAMQSCVARGIRQEGTLPGGLHVTRRAPALFNELSSKPEAAMRDPLDELDGALETLDAPLASRFKDAYRNGAKLRFLGRFDAESASVGLQTLPLDHPLCGGGGTDNRVAIFSDRYREQPLLIQGPGAGAEVTAAALLDDVLRIARH